MKRRKTIGESPLDAYVPQQPATATTEPREQQPPQRKRITFDLPVDLQDRVRNAVYWMRLTMNGFAEQALTEAAEKLERKYQKEHGEPIPAARQGVKPGRPVARPQ
jgi:hypothetical protein